MQLIAVPTVGSGMVNWSMLIVDHTYNISLTSYSVHLRPYTLAVVEFDHLWTIGPKAFQNSIQCPVTSSQKIQ